MGTRTFEETTAELAGRQHGVVTRRQLLEAGVAANTVKHRIETKRLRRVHHGVYTVGPVLSPNTREMAAALACGPTAAVSHRSAAALWELLPRRDSGPVDVTVPGDSRRRKPGIRVHRTTVLEPDEVGAVDGIPVTSPARTLLDIAGVVRPRELEQALARAERQHPDIRSELSTLIGRRPRRRGVRSIRNLLHNDAGAALTRSEAEERLLELIRRGRLPDPETNVMIAGYEVDFLWRRKRLVVEVDGFAFHASRRRFERDRSRDADLTALGYRVLRVTWRQLVDEPDAVLVRVAQALARVPGHRPGPREA
jgi:very-short-patch-repair endonuclease